MMNSQRTSLPVATQAALPQRRAKRQSLRLSERKAVLIVTDLIAVLLAVFLSLVAWARFAHESLSVAYFWQHLYWFVILATGWWTLATVNEYYQLWKLTHPLRSLRTMLFIDLELLILYLIIFFAFPTVLPRLFILTFSGIVLVTSGVTRLLRTATIRAASYRRKALVIGSGAVAHAMVHLLKSQAVQDFDVVGCITSYLDVASLPTSLSLLGFGADLPTVVAQYGIDEIIMTYVNEIPEDIFAGLLDCYNQGVTVQFMPQLYEEITGRVPIEHVGEHLWSLVLPLDNQSLPNRLNAASKRVLDVVCASILMIFAAPLIALAAIAIKLSSPGPIFFRQERVGQGGRNFTIFKLRTMRTDAEVKSGPVWASENDPRITRVGRFLRRSRVDELPQLLNVLRGDMTMVGPRPERPVFVEMLAKQIPFYKSRLVVKPGLTGWAQIRYRYGGSTEDALYKLQFDLYYIRHQSLLMDLLIMARTITIMLRYRGT